MTLYHVDTRGEIKKNSTIHPKCNRSFSEDLVGRKEYSSMRSLFFEGTTTWGYRKAILDLRDDGVDPIQVLREWIFEMYRRNNNVSAPSRFQCLFAWETAKDAKNYIGESEHIDGNAKVYELNSDEFSGPYYFDWIDGNSPAEMYWNAESYWEKLPFYREEEEVGPTEYLVPLPCKFGNVV